MIRSLETKSSLQRTYSDAVHLVGDDIILQCIKNVREGGRLCQHEANMDEGNLLVWGTYAMTLNCMGVKVVKFRYYSYQLVYNKAKVLYGKVKNADDILLVRDMSEMVLIEDGQMTTCGEFPFFRKMSNWIRFWTRQFSAAAFFGLWNGWNPQ